MPVGIQEIHPFLASILTGGAVKVGVGSRIGLVNEADQVVFHGGFVFHVKSKTAISDIKIAHNISLFLFL